MLDCLWAVYAHPSPWTLSGVVDPGFYPSCAQNLSLSLSAQRWYDFLIIATCHAGFRPLKLLPSVPSSWDSVAWGIHLATHLWGPFFWCAYRFWFHPGQWIWRSAALLSLGGTASGLRVNPPPPVHCEEYGWGYIQAFYLLHVPVYYTSWVFDDWHALASVCEAFSNRLSCSHRYTSISVCVWVCVILTYDNWKVRTVLVSVLMEGRHSHRFVARH